MPLASVLAAPALFAALLVQQPDNDAHRLQATRPDLVATLDRLRALRQADTSAVLNRLEEGDFRVGDRVLLEVEDPMLSTVERSPQAGKTEEQQLSDTFTVRSGPEVLLPVVGAVSLQGVLRSELELVLTKAVSRYIRDPAVHARSLINVGVTGEVTKPGYYSVAPDAVVSALINAAGGPTRDAKMSKLEIERDGHTLLKGSILRRAIEQGHTLDDLRARSGDQFVIPKKGAGDIYSPLRFLAVLLSIPVTVYTLTHLH